MRHKKFPSRLLILLITFVVIAYSGTAWVHGMSLPVDPTQTLSKLSATTVATPLSWPAYGQAAVGAEGYGLLDTHGGQTPVPTASTIKIMTAYAVLKAKPLSLGDQTTPLLTMTQADVDIYNTYLGEGGSVAAVSVGEQLSEYQALQAMLLPSANNMADSLAIWAFGSTANYVAYANQLATEIGLTDTHIDDASGFSPQTVSTAQDMVRLALLAMKDPVFAQIVSQPTATVPVAGMVHNVNALLGSDTVVGIKTGNTDQAGGCFVGAATQLVGGKTLTVITAIMAAPDLGRSLQDTLPLLASTKANFVSTTVLPKGTTVGSYRPAWSSHPVALTTAQDVTLTLWKGSRLSVDTGLKTMTAPVAAHTAVGTIYVHATGANASTPVMTTALLPAPSLSWRLRHPF